MTPQLFQTIYVFASLTMVLILSAIWQAKKECTCKVKVPAAFVGLATTIAIGQFVNGFTPLMGIISVFLFCMMLGSSMYPRTTYLGGVFHLIGYISLFVGFEIFGILDVFNVGLENIVIFGALLAISLMFLKKQDNVITVYIIGMCLFFIVSVLSGILPLVISSILIVLSELMIIYSNDFIEDTSDAQITQTAYFSAGLYSFGVLLLPLVIL